MNAKEAAAAVSAAFENHKTALKVTHHVVSLPGGLLDVFTVSPTSTGWMGQGGDPQPPEMWAVSMALAALGFPPTSGKRIILPPNVSLGVLGNEVTANVGPTASGSFPSLPNLRAIQETLRNDLPGVKVVVRMDAVILG